MRTTGVPGWLVFMGSTAVAMVFAIGLVTLLVLRIPVPDQLWILAGVIGTAYFGSGPFSLMSQHQAETASQQLQNAGALVDTVNHAIATLRDTAIANSSSPGTMSANPIPSGGTASVGATIEHS